MFFGSVTTLALMPLKENRRKKLKNDWINNVLVLNFVLLDKWIIYFAPKSFLFVCLYFSHSARGGC